MEIGLQISENIELWRLQLGTTTGGLPNMGDSIKTRPTKDQGPTISRSLITIIKMGLTYITLSE